MYKSQQQTAACIWLIFPPLDVGQSADEVAHCIRWEQTTCWNELLGFQTHPCYLYNILSLVQPNLSVKPVREQAQAYRRIQKSETTSKTIKFRYATISFLITNDNISLTVRATGLIEENADEFYNVLVFAVSLCCLNDSMHWSWHGLHKFVLKLMTHVFPAWFDSVPRCDVTQHFNDPINAPWGHSHVAVQCSTDSRWHPGHLLSSLVLK